MKATLLSNLASGTTGTVESIDLDARLSGRFAALGIHDGASVRLVRRALFGCPLHLRVGGSEVAIRRTEARRISIRTAR